MSRISDCNRDGVSVSESTTSERYRGDAEGVTPTPRAIERSMNWSSIANIAIEIEFNDGVC